MRLWSRCRGGCHHLEAQWVEGSDSKMAPSHGCCQSPRDSMNIARRPRSGFLHMCLSTWAAWKMLWAVTQGNCQAHIFSLLSGMLFLRCQCLVSGNYYFICLSRFLVNFSGKISQVPHSHHGWNHTYTRWKHFLLTFLSQAQVIELTSCRTALSLQWEERQLGLCASCSSESVFIGILPAYSGLLLSLDFLCQYLSPNQNQRSSFTRHLPSHIPLPNSAF